MTKISIWVFMILLVFLPSNVFADEITIEEHIKEAESCLKGSWGASASDEAAIAHALLGILKQLKKSGCFMVCPDANDTYTLKPIDGESKYSVPDNDTFAITLPGEIDYP